MSCELLSFKGCESHWDTGKSSNKSENAANALEGCVNLVGGWYEVKTKKGYQYLSSN